MNKYFVTVTTYSHFLLIFLFTGAIPKPKDTSFESLSESEKEAEMEKLMCMFDRLKELNVIKPAAVDKDGKITELETGNNQPGP